MDKMSFLEFVRERCPCGKLMGAPVAAERLERILEAVCIASTVHNKRSFRVFLLESSETVEEVHEITSRTFGAGYLLMMTAVSGEAWVCEFDQTNFVTVDASIVATHIMLAVEVEELGMAWVGYFDVPHTKELFPVVAPYELTVLSPIGEKVAEAHPTYLHEKRKLIADLVECF